MDENLEILKRLWTEKMVDGKYMAHNISAAVMYPKPVAAADADPDRRLCRQGAAARRHRRRRLADLFLLAGKFHEILDQDPRLRQGSAARTPTSF